MKNIATITTHAALNYGAVLQAYALHKFINDLGYNCKILNYVPAHVDKSYQLVGKPNNLQSLLLSVYQILCYSARKQRKERFVAFRNKYLNLSGDPIKEVKDLIDQVNTFDAVVCGSDQIWNPVLHDFDESYFLSFPGVTPTRISYAASFGLDVIDEAIKPELTRRLAGFSDFGCREHSAQGLIRELTGKEAQMVLDPVFLLDPSHWKSLAKPAQNQGQYALLYFLSNPGISPFAAKQYAQQNGMQTLSIGFSPRDYKYGVTCDYTLGPQEFLGAIASANTILTNSFHCTAFSILMQKNFYTRISSENGSRNDRMITLLTELGLEDRIYYDRDANQLDFQKPIDYAKVNALLNKKISESKAYIARALSDMA